MPSKADMARKIDPALIPPTPDLSLESEFWRAGVARVAGIDEAGRGALAGPVAAAACILPTDIKLPQTLHGVRDSKQMTPLKRQFWSTRLKETVVTSAVGFASAAEIDALGIIPATRLAASRAIEMLSIRPDHLLLDYLFLPDNPIPQTSLIKGDARSLSIAAASILAKTARDAYLCELDGEFPGYRFSAHKGYGTADHRSTIMALGGTPVHRHSFAPLRNSQWVVEDAEHSN
jgi:ribonuclease HII